MGTINSQNARDAIIALVAANALPALMAKTRMANLVNRNYESEVKNAGETVSIPIPPVMTAVNLAESGTLSFQNPDPGFAMVNLNRHMVVPFAITDIFRVLNASNPIAELNFFMEPAMIAIAQAIETDLANLYPQVALTAGSTSAPIDEAAIDAAETALFNAQVPEEVPKYLIAHATPYGTIRNLARFSEQEKIGNTDAIVTGEVGRIKNFNTMRSYYAVKDGSNVYHNLAFSRDAFALVFRNLPPIDAPGAIAQVMNFNGFAIRIVYSYSHTSMQQQFSADVLYGCSVLRPQFCVDIQSNG